MEEQIFYCPYDLAIQTMTIITDSKLVQIKKLEEQGYTEEEIDDLML